MTNFTASQYSVEHVALAKQADVVLIAPASANVIGKIAGGIADDRDIVVQSASRRIRSSLWAGPDYDMKMYDLTSFHSVRPTTTIPFEYRGFRTCP